MNSSNNKFLIKDKNLFQVSQEAYNEVVPSSTVVKNVTTSGNTMTITYGDGSTQNYTINAPAPDIVSAGTAGPTGNVSMSNNGTTGTVKIPYVSINAKGLVTALANRTWSLT